MDKALGRCASKINISFSDDGVFTVKDNGFPIGITNNHDEWLIEVLLTQLFACRDLKPYTDLCKNGIVVSNALSEFFLYDCGDGKNHWQQKYQFGMPINSLRKISQTDEIWEQFSFLPDKKLIPNSKFETESFVDWLKSKSLSIKNRIIFLNDKTVKHRTKN